MIDSKKLQERTRKAAMRRKQAERNAKESRQQRVPDAAKNVHKLVEAAADRGYTWVLLDAFGDNFSTTMEELTRNRRLFCDLVKFHHPKLPLKLIPYGYEQHGPVYARRDTRIKRLALIIDRTEPAKEPNPQMLAGRDDEMNKLVSAFFGSDFHALLGEFPH